MINQVLPKEVIVIEVCRNRVRRMFCLLTFSSAHNFWATPENFKCQGIVNRQWLKLKIIIIIINYTIVCGVSNLWAQVQHHWKYWLMDWYLVIYAFVSTIKLHLNNVCNYIEVICITSNTLIYAVDIK